MTRFDELPPRDGDLARSLHVRLRASQGDVDVVTAARLRAARARAMDATGRPAVAGWLYATGGLVAAVTIAALLVVLPPHSAGAPTGNGIGHPSQPEALDVLTDDVDAELYEDLDLYRWLEREHDGAA